MIPGLAKSFGDNGDVREQYCEIVRVLHDFQKVLVRFPGNPRVYVKALRNVELSQPQRFAGRNG